MAESVLADPIRQIGRWKVSPPRVVTLGGGVPSQVCGEDPERVALTVIEQDSIPFTLAPDPRLLTAVAAATGPLLPTVVHMSVYPVLIANAWYAIGPPGPLNLIVWETTQG